MKYQDHRELALQEFKDNIDVAVTTKGTILDIGCRDCWFRERLNQLGWSWIGLDKNGGDSLVKSSMENMPLPDDSIHVVFCCNSFEHTENPLQTLKEFRRILRGGGLLFMTTPYPCQRQIFRMDKTHYFVLNEMQLGRLLYVTGFIPVKMFVNKNDSEDEGDWQIVTIANVI